MQAGDVLSTSADTSRLENWVNFKPGTSIEYGIQNLLSGTKIPIDNFIH